jgi:hypothetical protein
MSWVPCKGLKGNQVKFLNGPAAVADESEPNSHWGNPGRLVQKAFESEVRKPAKPD